MNSNIEKLYQIANKQTRRIIGLMSGTSMDGLDVVLCEFEGQGGETQVRVLNFKTVPFDESIKDEIRKVFARREIDFQQLALLNPWIGNLHGSIVLDCLKEWNVNPADIDCIASHGQTVFHAPKILHGLAKFPNTTLQIGDGDHMAVTTGIITLSDFRQKHCAAGGEGAPLAVYGDYLIFSKPGENRILLNMGGIANFTYLPANLNADEVFATDTGTGNTLIDAVTRKYFDLPYDENAEIAQRGVINEALIAELKNDPFFQKTFPKTTGPELFNLDYLQRAQQRSQTEELSPEDVLATLTRFSAETIAEAVKQSLDWHESSTQWVIYASGGGVHNPLLLAYIQELLPKFSLRKTDELGILGDAKEAVLFATLANEALAGGKTNFGQRQGVPSVSMGKISFPH
ncbi:anhydro-N-acetylmuramic acid kinase [Siphonobacter sp. SORGH_AS_1065]|uniref:anhydro-N-acetylmuramic acid kinase n=1 Tax=Siphonobacter sp. SORGH_AS_1065 TaxID=3041795 RepID=UPI0027812CCD|nr:anhydro-N-acetylmuramic acid kinase [Siphonobacter sp. SORGH_AS_1065]MDQ1088819.1 anhydro-N-acetylmuramic acid kinase [Siphonobacter sp. SORGH_AS_1065]